MLAILDAGKAAALHIYLNFSASHPVIASGRVVNSTSNRLGLAPPPTNCDLKLESVLFSLEVAILGYPPVLFRLRN
jgi:hypothetical protein